jgi:hypothetical protein
MTYVECAGGQNKATTTSETHPEKPPQRTENCYTTGGEANFDWGLCGTSGDRACLGRGGKIACKPDNQGGYCKQGDNYYEARGIDFVTISQSDLLDRYSREGNTDETGREVNRALNDQERKFTNRIRELQIMGKDPLVQKSGSKKGEDKEVHNFVGDMLFNVGIGFSSIMFIISVCIILIQNKFI